MTDKQLTDQFLNAPKDSKPDFLGVGIHKTGTSWVHAMLKDHPQISMATNPGGAGQGKEFGFWLEDSNMDPKAYMHRFSCEDGNVKGEFTPSYAAKLKTLQLIRSSLPDVKIVCGLRDPRYIFHSAYLHERRGGSITSLTDYYNFVVSKNILDDSNLDRIVDNINKTFPSENIHYYFYSKMKNNPKKEIQKIYSFLGVDPDFTPKTLGVRINARYQFRSLFLYKATSTFLKYFYKGKNDFKQLINTPHLRPWWVSFLLKINEKNINKHKISPEEIKTLQDKNIMSMGEKTMSQFSKDHWEE